MSDAEPTPRRATVGALRVDRQAFLAAFAAKGCTTGRDRAALLQMPRRSVSRYVDAEVVPLLPTARWIAAQLDVKVDELWPAA